MSANWTRPKDHPESSVVTRVLAGPGFKYQNIKTELLFDGDRYHATTLARFDLPYSSSFEALGHHTNLWKKGSKKTAVETRLGKQFAELNAGFFIGLAM